MKVRYPIDNYLLELDVESESSWGDDEILLKGDDDLTATRSWHSVGFTVQPLLKPNQFKALSEGIRQLYRKHLDALGIVTTDDFKLDQYHTLVNDAEHYQMVLRFRNYFNSDTLSIDKDIITNRISEICGIELTNDSGTIGEFYFLRMIRPNGRQDFNPPHRDVYLERIRNAINCYIPICGSNELSSLPVMPGSHLWKESEIERTETGSLVNEVQYTVPCVTDTKHGLSMTRPNPKPNEVLVFSPYMVHGGAINLNKNQTRISLEMRFWRK